MATLCDNYTTMTCEKRRHDREFERELQRERQRTRRGDAKMGREPTKDEEQIYSCKR
jgi:hypothetical protein